MRPLELQAITLRQYREITANLRRPTLLQASAFAEFVSRAHSWYKKLPVVSSGSGFSFYLSPDAGVDVWWDENEGLRRKPRLPEDKPLHYSWKTTEQTIDEFAHLEYCRYRDFSGVDLPPASSAWFSKGQDCLALPHSLLQETFAECTALLHPQSNRLSSVCRLPNFRALLSQDLMEKDFSPLEWRVVEIVRASVEDVYLIADLQEEFAELANTIRDKQLVAITQAIERLERLLDPDWETGTINREMVAVNRLEKTASLHQQPQERNSMIRKTILCLLGLLGLFTLYLLVVWLGVFPRTTDAQLQALNLLEQPYRYAQGKQNAYPQLWLLQYDIPRDKIADEYATDIRDYKEADKRRETYSFKSKLDKKYPKQTLDTKKLCPLAPKSCLAFVRSNSDQARAQAALYSGYLQRIERLRDSDHVINDSDLGFFGPLPPMSGIGQLQTLASAVDFIDGKHTQALDSTCLSLAAWRRLRSHTDMILIDMVSISWAKADIVLLAEMLAELPADAALPSSCDIALAPLASDELDQCDLARGEMTVMSDFLKAAKGQYGEFSSASMGADNDQLRARLINVRASRARIAPWLASLCAGQPVHQQVSAATRRETFFDPGGVWFTDLVAGSTYMQYKTRAEDFAGLLQTLRTVIWLRKQSDVELASRLQPDDLKMPKYKPVWNTAGKTLSVEMQFAQNNDPKIWTLPMAASRIAPEPTGPATPQ